MFSNCQKFKQTNMQKHLISILTLLFFASLSAYSQITYSLKAEAGYLNFRHHTVQVDPGPGWLGYNLDRQNGTEVNIINGLNYKEKLFAGVGVGYLNFEGVPGLSIFPDLEYVPFNSRLSPLLNIRAGYSHIWNQYEGGTGSALGELALGLNYKLTKNLGIYVKSGFLWTQQSKLIPVRLGLRF